MAVSGDGTGNMPAAVAMVLAPRKPWAFDVSIDYSTTPPLLEKERAAAPDEALLQGPPRRYCDG
jgi:hypothetical protein